LWVKLFIGMALVAGICVGLAFVPTRDVAYAPAPPIDLDGKITVDGTPLEPLQGRLYLVGVTERHVNLLQRAALDIGDSTVDFAKAPTLAKLTGPSAGDIASMKRAKEVSAAVAYELAGTGGKVVWTGQAATVGSTQPGLPAAGKLFPGDVIEQVNGVGYDNSVDVGRAINQLKPGSKVVLFVRRAGEATKVSLTTVEPVAGDAVHRSRLGLGIDTIGLQVRLPHKVEVDSGAVVGPSAGLAFALAMYDAFEPNTDLLRGRHIVATGSLTPDGQVAPVGRVRQKAIATQAAGHDLLLVPTANVEEAKAAIADACTGDARCVEVIGVGSVQQAIQVLRGS
jgi:PDZ domain-containing protein